jgi:hypothetical protein
MNRLGAFVLHFQPGDPHTPARMAIGVQRAVQREDGRIYITPECSTFDEIEGHINALQDELDRMRERARRMFAERT